MELLITPQWAPNLHPLLVHFPIAILMIAAIANLSTFLLPDKWWDETKNTILYVTGTVFAGVTYYSGTVAADTIFLPTEAQSVLSEHANWAEYLLWFFVLYSLLRLAFHRFKLFDKTAFQIIAFITVLPGLFMVYETAEYGGKMVFGYGAGTGQLLQQEDTTESTYADTVAVSSSFIQKDNGDWTWEMDQNSVSDLLAQFHWMEGSVQELKPLIVSDDPQWLKFEASEQPNLFVTHNAYQNVQVDFYLNVEDLTGEVMLVHHLQDAQNFDFVSLNSEGEIRQGRVEQGSTTIFQEGSYEATGTLFVRVVGDGTHFRGYVNREMKVHGHGDAPNEGSVGLRIQGTGSVLISKIEMTQL